MIAIFQQVQIVDDFLRLILLQAAAKLTVKLRGLASRQINNGPSSIRLAPLIKVKFSHGTRCTLDCQTDRLAKSVFKSIRSAR